MKLRWVRMGRYYWIDEYPKNTRIWFWELFNWVNEPNQPRPSPIPDNEI